MKPVTFIEAVEGDDSKPLGGGKFGATWDKFGKCWNIGAGLTHGITKNTVMTQPELDAALAAEMHATEVAVDRLVKVPLGENQRTVCVSLAYNIGITGFEESSVLRLVNQRRFSEVPARLKLFNKSHGVVVKGLINRRDQEIALWVHPDEHPSFPVESVSVPKADPHPLTKETTMAFFGSLLVSLLASDQIQSLLRTTLKVAGTALVAKAGADTGSVDTIVGGIIGLIGLFGSIVSHSPTAKANQPIAS